MNSELMTVVNYLERDRGVNREVIVQAIESALLSAARKTVGISNDVQVTIDRKSLQIRAFDTVTATDEDTGVGFLSLRKARELKPNVQPGDTLTLEIPPEKLGRIAAQTARQMILQKIRQAERDHVYEEYKDRVGDIVSGTVRQITHRDLIVEIGKAEAILSAKDRISTEEYQIGDRVRAFILKVQSGATGPALVLSRSCPEFVKALFRLEVSEIADGIVEVMSVARDPGYRSKIAVRSNDDKVDPVGACVGLRGTRVKNIVRELSGEKIDIVRWHEDARQYITQALSPAKLASIEIDPVEYHTVNITVDPDQLSLAIGRHGQNVRLTAKLTGWRVNIKKNETETFEEQVTHAIEHLAGVPGISREEADTLVKNGFLTADGILAAEIPYIQEVTGFDETTAQRIWDAAAATNPGEDNA
jgi:N utilization substance protein A